MNDILVKNITKQYEGFKLNDISFEVPKGSVVGFIGENGAGKTTTIKLILDEIKKDKGEITVLGQSIIDDKIKDNIGVVLDDSFLSDYLTPDDINKIMRNIYSNWDEKLYFEYIKTFNISVNKLIKNLSSGMKMKLKIITALSHHPQLLILDEPTSGLDPIIRSEILDLFRDFVEDEKHSIFISSHITSDLEHIADYLVFIHKGEIVLKETMDKLLNEYGIVKCSKEEFEKIDNEDIIKFLGHKYNYEVLINNKNNFKKKYNMKVIDKPNIDEIMLIFVKGGNKDE